MTRPLIAPARSAPILGVSYDAELLYRPRDGLLSTLTGQVPGFGRSDSRTAHASNGVCYEAPRDFARWEALDLNRDGVTDAMALALDQNATNYAGYSQSLANWTMGVGSPNVAGNTIESGALRLQHAIDDQAGQAEEWWRDIATWGSAAGTYAFSVYVAKSYAPVTLGSRLYIDASGNVRFSATITWNGTAPVVSNVTGTYRGAVFVGYRDDTYGLPTAVYRLFFLTTAAFTPSATNSLRCVPAGTPSDTGGVMIGGFQIEDSPLTTAYIATPAGSTVSRAADSFYIPWQVPPRHSITVFVRFMEVGAAAVANAKLLSIGNAGATGARLTIESSGSYWRVTHDNNTVVVSSTLTVAPAFGDDVLLRATLDSNGMVKLGQTIGSGAEVVAAPSSTNYPTTAWADTRVQLAYPGWVVSTRLIGLAIVRGWDVAASVGAGLLR